MKRFSINELLERGILVPNPEDESDLIPDDQCILRHHRYEEHSGSEVSAITRNNKVFEVDWYHDTKGDAEEFTVFVPLTA